MKEKTITIACLIWNFFNIFAWKAGQFYKSWNDLNVHWDTCTICMLKINRRSQFHIY